MTFSDQTTASAQPRSEGPGVPPRGPAASAPARPTWASSLASHKLTFTGILNAERIKMLSLRSTWWIAGISVLLMAAVAALFALIVATLDTASGAQVSVANQESGWSVVTAGFSFSQLVVAVLGALTITGEFGTGSIRSTFTADPRRLPTLGAKAIVVCLAGVAMTLVGELVSWIIAALWFRTSLSEAVPRLDSPDAWRALLGTALAGGILAILALAVGAIIRNSTGAIFTLVALHFVLPSVIAGIATEANKAWVYNISAILPVNVASTWSSYSTTSAESTLGSGYWTLTPGQGLSALVAWTVVLLIVGGLVTKLRDA